MQLQSIVAASCEQTTKIKHKRKVFMGKEKRVRLPLENCAEQPPDRGHDQRRLACVRTIIFS